MNYEKKESKNRLHKDQHASSWSLNGKQISEYQFKKLLNEVSEAAFNFSGFNTEMEVSNDIHDKFMNISYYVLRGELRSSKSIEKRTFPNWLVPINAIYDSRDFDDSRDFEYERNSKLNSYCQKLRIINEDCENEDEDYEIEYSFDFLKKDNILDKKKRIKTSRSKHQYFENFGSKVEEAFQEIEPKTLTQELYSAKFPIKGSASKWL